jgi:hypothetical protein
MGGSPPKRWNPSPPHQQPQRRHRSRRSWWAQKRSPPGSLWKRQRAPRKHQRVAEVSGSAAAAAIDAAAVSVEPSRKRKQGFSTLR